MTQIEDKADEYWKVLIMPNKCDIPNKEPRKRVVPTQRAQEYAQSKNILFYGEWSAFQNINVRTSIKRLVQDIYDTQKELIAQGKRKPEGLKLSYEQQHNNQDFKRWWK